jgi:hypothetical protein
MANKHESIKYKKENNNIPFLKQGVKLFDNIKQKINNEFSRATREGFVNGGILGPNTSMNLKNQSDALITESKVNAIENNLAQYSSGRDELREKTSEYLGTSGLRDRNYNLFINTLPNPDTREITKCVKKTTLTDLTTDPRFITSYPSIATNQNASNFSDFSKANEACKIWAVDSNEPVFALTRDASYMYNCHVGNNNQSNSPVYTYSTLAYKLNGAVSADANRGGLFANGLVGVYKHNIITSTIKIKNECKISVITNTRPFNIGLITGGTPWGNGSGWGRGMREIDSTANWIWPNNRINEIGFSDYLYYFFTNPTNEIKANLHICADDGVEFELNGISRTIRVTSITQAYEITIKSGLNVFMFRLNNTAGSGGLVVAVTGDIGEGKQVLFNSNGTNKKWGVSTQKCSYADIIASNIPDTNILNPDNIHYYNGYTHDDEKMKNYTICDKYNGGNINRESINASYGRNCSNITQTPRFARYIKVLGSGDYVQISQIAVWGYEKGQLTNLAYKGRPGGPGAVIVKSILSSCNENSKYTPIDGVLKARGHDECRGIYHSAVPRIGEFWLLDLGDEYPITKIDYYNRAECCNERAMNMTINLYNTMPNNNATNQSDGLLNPPLTLNRNLVQEFNITT